MVVPQIFTMPTGLALSLLTIGEEHSISLSPRSSGTPINLLSSSTPSLSFYLSTTPSNFSISKLTNRIYPL